MGVLCPQGSIQTFLVMKRITQIVFLIFLLEFSHGQTTGLTRDSISKLLQGKGGCFFLNTAPKEKEYEIKMRANSISNKEMLLYIVDGVPKEEHEVKKIDPNCILSINILKPSDIKLGCRPVTKIAIVITTKADQHTIIIKDAETGMPIPAATVEIKSEETKNDKTYLIADSNGKIITTKTGSGKEYWLRVSSVGYKNFTSIVNTNISTANDTIRLEKDRKLLDEIVLASTVCMRTIRYAGKGCKILREEKNKIEFKGQIIPKKIYPNPVLRSQKINLELIMKDERKIILKLFSLDGKLVGSKEYRSIIGINRFNYTIPASITAGIYSVQIIDRDNQLIKMEKMIVQ